MSHVHGDAPLATVTVPAAIGTRARNQGRIAALVCGGLALLCVLMAVVTGLVVAPVAGVATGAGALFWGLLAGAAWWWAHHSAAARAGWSAGQVIVAVRRDGLDVGSGIVLPYATVDAVALWWFSLGGTAPVLGRPGTAVGNALIAETYRRTGGDLGLAVLAYPRDPEHLRRLQPQLSRGAGPTGTNIAFDASAQRPAVVVRIHRLVVEGADPTVVAGALAERAAAYGVTVLGDPAPPAQPPPLPDWLRG